MWDASGPLLCCEGLVRAACAGRAPLPARRGAGMLERDTGLSGFETTFTSSLEPKTNDWSERME